ncbi:MAG: hypothetical protein MZU97_11080 [Bacillus subtilis]|nr:hypothetical protein [Bacillus subtilis]
MDFELELIRWMQSFQNGFWDTLFQFFTMFGEELIIIGALGYLYWCHDKKVGEYVGVTVFISALPELDDQDDRPAACARS